MDKTLTPSPWTTPMDHPKMDGETIELNLVVELEKPQASAVQGDWTCQNYGLGKTISC